EAVGGAGSVRQPGGRQASTGRGGAASSRGRGPTGRGGHHFDDAGHHHEHRPGPDDHVGRGGHDHHREPGHHIAPDHHAPDPHRRHLSGGGPGQFQQLVGSPPRRRGQGPSGR